DLTRRARAGPGRCGAVRSEPGCAAPPPPRPADVPVETNLQPDRRGRRPGRKPRRSRRPRRASCRCRTTGQPGEARGAAPRSPRTIGSGAALPRAPSLATRSGKPRPRQLPPLARLVDGKGRVAWSGHPAAIDQPLAKLVAGEWDADAEAKKYAALLAQQNRVEIDFDLFENKKYSEACPRPRADEGRGVGERFDPQPARVGIDPAARRTRAS